MSNSEKQNKIVKTKRKKDMQFIDTNFKAKLRAIVAKENNENCGKMISFLFSKKRQVHAYETP